MRMCSWSRVSVVTRCSRRWLCEKTGRRSVNGIQDSEAVDNVEIVPVGDESSETPARVSRPLMKFIPAKVRGQMEEMYVKDPKTWTPKALAERFGAPVENVRAILTLREMEKSIASSVGVPAEAEEADGIWKSLVEPTPRPGEDSGLVARRRGRLDLPQRIFFRPPNEEEEFLPLAPQEAEHPPTPTARWVATLPAQLPLPNTKRTGFIFMEVGERISDMNRAIFVRDGDGSHRQATIDERITMLKSRRTGCAPIVLSNQMETLDK
mmetsp:Transcript_445/g.818  ORF Transcript_445/g.818 Transcript_445/m.818 type:complete len:266 (-) Transcript_445:746-1543(-)